MFSLHSSAPHCCKTQDKDTRQRRKTEDARKTLGRRSEDAGAVAAAAVAAAAAAVPPAAVVPASPSLPHRRVTAASSLQCHTFWTI